MAGKRHHTVPKFILKKFACEVNDKHYYSYLYSKARPMMKINIDNISVEEYFYGRPEESDLDNRITDLESDYAPLWEKLSQTEQGKVPDNHLLPGLISHLSTRTQHVRRFGQNLIERIINLTCRELGRKEVFEKILAKDLETEGSARDRLLRAAIMTGVPDEHVKKIDASPKARKLIARNLLETTPDLLSNSILAVQDSFQSQLKESVRSSFIDFMSRSLTDGPHQNLFKGLHFFVIDSNTPLLLGDSICCFETGGKRRFSPFVSLDTDLRQCYVALTPRKALLGAYASTMPDFNAEDWNLVTARCSEEYFVSTTVLSPKSQCLTSLGIWAGILSRREIASQETKLKKRFISEMTRRD